MGRFRAVLIVAGILLVSGGGAAVVKWQAKAHGVPSPYILGPLMVVIGIGFTVAHLSVSDDYLRQHYGGEEKATRTRQMWRSGWVGVLIGVALVAAQYFLDGKLEKFKVNDASFRNPPPAFVKGKLLQVDKTLVKLSLGTDDGVNKDHTLMVYRTSPELKFLGYILVTAADLRESSGQLIVQPDQPVPTLMVGDVVASQLSTR